MTPAPIIGVAVLLPVIGAFVVLMLGRSPNAREAATLITGGALFALVMRLIDPVLAGEALRLDLVEVVPGVLLTLQVEPLGLLFALVASFLWIVTSLYAIGYMRGHHEKNKPVSSSSSRSRSPRRWASPSAETSSRYSRSTRC